MAIQLWRAETRIGQETYVFNDNQVYGSSVPAYTGTGVTITASPLVPNLPPDQTRSHKLVVAGTPGTFTLTTTAGTASYTLLGAVDRPWLMVTPGFNIANEITANTARNEFRLTAGLYTLEEALVQRSDLKILGAGRTATQFRRDARGSPAACFRPSHHLSVQDMWIRSPANLPLFADASGTTWKNMEFVNCQFDDLDIGSLLASGLLFRDCVFNRCRIGTSVSNWLMHRCQINGHLFSAAEAISASPSSGQAVWLIDCEINRTQVRISGSGTGRIVMAHTRIQQSPGPAIISSSGTYTLNLYSSVIADAAGEALRLTGTVTGEIQDLLMQNTQGIRFTGGTQALAIRGHLSDGGWIDFGAGSTSTANIRVVRPGPACRPAWAATTAHTASDNRAVFTQTGGDNDCSAASVAELPPGWWLVEGITNPARVPTLIY